MPHRILVVEDEPSIAELIAVNLTHSGFTVERALQTDEAMRMMRVNKPDLLILDWMMSQQMVKQNHSTQLTHY